MTAAAQSSNHRGHTIFSIGFSTPTRRFLMGLGLKTLEDLSEISSEYLISQGANCRIAIEATLPPALLPPPNGEEVILGNTPADERPCENPAQRVIDLSQGDAENFKSRIVETHRAEERRPERNSAEKRPVDKPKAEHSSRRETTHNPFGRHVDENDPFERLKRELPGCFYTKSSFDKAFKKVFHSDSVRKRSAAILHLGFIDKGGYLLERSWGSISAYFNSLVCPQTFFNPESIEYEIRTTPEFKRHIAAMVKQLKLLPYEDGTYITERGLGDLGVSKNALNDFVTETSVFCSKRNKRYCTIKSLRDDGFESKLLDYEMDDEFYMALLCSQKSPFRSVKCAGKRIAYLGKSKVDSAAFIESQVENDESIAPADLAARIERRFGVPITEDAVRRAADITSLYFSKLTGLLYKNKDTFYKEI